MMRFVILGLAVSFGCNANDSNSKVTAEAPRQVVVNEPVDSLYIAKTLSFCDQVEHNLSSYKQLSKDIGGSTEGGEAKIFIDSKDTVKIEVTFYGETGKSIQEYYYEGKQFVLFKSKDVFYREPINTTSDVEIDSTAVERIVLKDMKVVHWVQDEQIKAENLYPEKTKEVLILHDELISLIRQ